MEIFSALLGLCEWNPPVISFDIFFDVRLNKLLGKPSRCRWFGTLWRSLWRHCYDIPRITNAVFALLCYVLNWLCPNYPYVSRLLHWQRQWSNPEVLYNSDIKGQSGAPNQRKLDWLLNLNCLFVITKRKHQSSALQTRCEGNLPADSPHNDPVMWKAFPCHDLIIEIVMHAN